MSVKISHIIIPVKSVEAMKKAGEFFINVVGLHIRDGFPSDGVPTGTDIWTEQGTRKPDRILHMMDDHDTFVDLVYYENRPTSFAKGIGSGKGFSLAFRVPDIKEAWEKCKDYPVQPICDPITYSDEPEPIIMEGKEPWLGEYFAFCALDMGRVSEDGEEQIIELCEMKPE